MLRKNGITLMEILVVLAIIGVLCIVVVPVFTSPSESARALNAKNNLLTIYTAQQNYTNNNGNYCLKTANTASASCSASTGDNTCADSLAAINCNLSLYIPDDGTFTYQCSGTTCVATRNNGPGALTLTITLNAPIKVAGGVNPVCAAADNTWCP